MAAVLIRNVHKYFGGTHVIRGVDIDIGELREQAQPSPLNKTQADQIFGKHAGEL